MRARHLFLTIAFTSITLGAQTPVPAARAVKPHARVSLVADATTLTRNEPTWIGVRFQLDPGWRVFWRNAGETGSAPRVEWQFHETSRRMGEIEWPTPARFTTGNTVSYGYTNEVVLLAPLRLEIPARSGGASAGRSDDPGAIEAAVTYVVCRDVCVEETAVPGIDVKDAGAKLPAAGAGLIAAWRTRLPQPLPRKWKATATLTADSWLLVIDRDHRADAATFFPAQAGLIHDSGPVRIEPGMRGIVMHLWKSPFFSKAPTVPSGVVVFPEAGAYAIEAPITVKDKIIR